MNNFLSNRQRELKIGIVSYTENNTVLEVTGKVGIGTTNATSTLHVQGNSRVTGARYDSNNSAGTSGQILSSTVTGTQWVNAAPAEAITGLIIRDEGTIVGTSGSVTSLNFVGGNVTATAAGANATITLADNLVGAALSIAGISTFTNGPVLIGSGSSTGTASQRLQVTGGAYVSGNLGINTTNPTENLSVLGKIQISQDSGSNNRLIFRSQPGSLYRWSIDNYGSNNEFRIFREDDATTANGSVALSISTTGTVTATRFSGDGSLLTNIPGSTNYWSQTSVGINTLSNVGIGTTNPTSKLTVSGNASISGILTVDQLYTSNNGAGLNVRIGDDFWLGDVNIANTTRFSGTQDSTKAFVIFGSSDAVALGRTGTGPLYYGGNFSVAGVLTASSFSGNLTGTATSTTNIPNLSGDVTSNNTVTTLATVNSNVGTFGSSTAIPSITVNAKGLVTGVTTNAITVGDGTLTLATSGTGLSGSASFSANQSTGTTFTVTSNATSSNTASTLVARDSSGGFSAGIITATSFVGNLTGNATSASTATYATTAGIATYASVAGVATALQNARTISITGDVSGSVTFDGTSNVSIAATIQPNSVALGGDTTGDYVQSIAGTSNQITVTSGTGEGSTPTLSIPSQFTAPQDVTVTRDLQVNRNLNVNGSITIGGTSATLFTTEFKVYDPDIVLGFRTDALGNDVSTDNTANHGGIAIASTEGTPLISLYDVGVGETNPATYKKFMWFKSGTFTGLGTDAWISNYAIGIGSTQVPNGVRLAAGGMQVTNSTLSVPQLNISGVSTFTGNATFASNAYFGDNDSIYFGDGNDLRIYHSGTNSHLSHVGTNDLYIQSVNGIYLQNATNEAAIYARPNGAVELYFDNAKEFETTGYGATVFGTLQSQGLQVSGIATFQSDVKLGDNDSLYFGDGNDLRIYSDGDNSFIKELSSTGSLYIDATNLVIRDQSGAETGAIFAPNGSASLYFDNVKEFETTGYGATVYGVFESQGLNVSGVSTISSNSSTNALRITQLGSGNALVVEDETNPDATPFVVTAAGDVGIGTNIPRRKLHLRTSNADGIYLDSSDQTGNSGAPTLRVRGQRVDGNTSQSFSGQLALEKWRMDASIQSGQNLGAIIFGGNFDTAPGITTGITYGASIGAIAEGTFSNINTAPTAIVFNTGTVGLGTLGLSNLTYGTEAARITSNRNLLIGATSESGTASQKLQVTGGAYVSGNTGIGTTNPTSPLHVVGNSLITGIITASGGFNLGISSAGTSITSGPVTRLNFIGAGNTFAINGTTVDISIAGGGGGGVSISTVAPSSPTAGDLWYNSNLGRTFIYYYDGSSSQWVDAAPFNVPERERSLIPGKTSSTFTATTGQTVFTVSYNVGFIEVYLNGIRLNSSEYIANNGSSVILVEGASAGDVVDVIEFRVGVGDTGAQGVPGPLSNVVAITTNSSYYPLFVSGTGDTYPYIVTTNDYFEINPSSGTINVNQLNVVGVVTSSRLAVGVTNPAANTQVAIAGTLGISEVSGSGARTLLSSSGSGFILNHNDNSNINIQSQGSNKLTYQVSSNAWVIPTGGTSLVVGTGGTTGTASQPLQVTGGGYVSGSVGIGITNPSDKLHTLGGNIRVDSATGALSFWSGAGFYGAIGVSGGLGGSGTDIVLRADSTRSLIFQTGGANDRGRIDSNGNLGIATNNPLQRLHVQGNLLVAAGSSTGQHITQKAYELNNGTLSWEGSAGQLFSITNNLTSGSIFSVNDVSGIPSIDVDASGVIELAPFGGNVGVGTINPTSKLHVVGNALVTGIVTATDFNSTSDINLKGNIQKIQDPIEKVLQINGVSFNWKNTSETSAGVIAQEVEKVMPEIVNTNEGHKTLNYNGLIGLLVEAVKEQQEQINTLKMEIENLKK